MSSKIDTRKKTYKEIEKELNQIRRDRLRTEIHEQMVSHVMSTQTALAFRGKK